MSNKKNHSDECLAGRRSAASDVGVSAAHVSENVRVESTISTKITEIASVGGALSGGRDKSDKIENDN